LSEIGFLPVIASPGKVLPSSSFRPAAPAWMKPSDIVKIEIERIGILRTSNVDER